MKGERYVPGTSGFGGHYRGVPEPTEREKAEREIDMALADASVAELRLIAKALPAVRQIVREEMERR